MNGSKDYFKILIEIDSLEGETLTPKEIIETYRRLRMLSKTHSKLCMKPGVIKFMLNPLKDKITFLNTPTQQVDFTVDSLSYGELKVKINDILSRAKEDYNNITLEMVYQYNDLARASNKIVQILLDLSGEFRAYWEGEQVVHHDLL